MRMRKKQLGDQVDPVMGGGDFGNIKLNRGSFKDFYKVGSILGQGAFGIVRVVTRKVDNSKWAVKVIEKSRINPGDHALQTEIDILCRVNQPNCVCLKEWFDEPRRVLLVMELVTGGTVFDRIVQTGNFNEEIGRKVFRDLASGLDYLHGRGIAHRDLKPENVLLRSNKHDAHAMLTDYGLSKILTDPAGGNEKTVCGTPSYVAPEVLLCLTGQETLYNAVVADAWSLGVNLYILLSGYPPFWRYEDNQKEMFEHIRMNDWSFDQSCWDSISEDAKDLIKSLMEPDMHSRITVKQALKHKWCAEAASNEGLTETLVNLSQRQLAHKFRKAGLAALAKTRLERLVAGLSTLMRSKTT